MKHLFTSGIILLCLLYGLPAHAQGENKVWCFGRKTGLNFNTSPPAFFQHNMEVSEGSASISDAGGNLLFYSSGANNWDRNGNLMPNGTGMSGNGPFLSNGMNAGSSLLGVAIVPSPSNAQQYYMITTDANENNSAKAYYSVIDMSLNGGMGDVVPGQKNILLATDVAEGVLTQKADHCGAYWVVLYGKTNPGFRSFKIDAAGVNPIPVTSAGPASNFGHLCFNLQGTMLVRGSLALELLAFDKSTGIFTPIGSLSTPGPASRNVFSPDGSKLYAGANGVFQFDLNLLPNMVAVQSSRIQLDPGSVFHMRNGPDGKIYILRSILQKIGVIDNPDATGLACAYNPVALNLPAYGTNFVFAEMGSPVVVNPPGDTTARFVLDTMICQLPQLTLNTPAAHQSYLWNTGGTGAQETITNDGTYWVYGRDSCSLSIDSFRVRFIRFDSRLGRDTAVCSGYELRPGPDLPGATYLWQDGSTAAAYTVTEKGTYYVFTTVETCPTVDTIVVDIIDPAFIFSGQDTTVCAGTQLSLHAQLFPEGTYLWNTGSTSASILTGDAGTYTVTGINACGTFSDSVHITSQYCNCTAYTPNAFSPNGDGKNDLFVVELHCPAALIYSHTIYNRYGQKVFESKQPDQFWNGMFNGSPCDAGTYFYYLEYKNGQEKIKKKGDLVLIR
jgi:gliding motility-associated-like protein